MRARHLALLVCAASNLYCGGQTNRDNSGSAASGGFSGSGGTHSGGSGASGGAPLGGSGGVGGTPNGGSGGLAGGCSTPNPEGCATQGCPPTSVCDKNFGCAPSSCTCSGADWLCTGDCSGGTCVPITPSDCNSIAASISQQTNVLPACTTVVRLDYLTHAVVGFMFFTSPYQSLTETDARTLAQTDTGFGNGELLSGPNPSDAWIFYTPPGDFGGASAVSARIGHSVFGGSIVWAGQGDVVFPTVWNTYDVGHDCPPTTMPPARGFDLFTGSSLVPQELAEALQAVAQTAIPAGLSWGTLFDAVVLLYPRAVGVPPQTGFDPKTTELIVILNSGFLGT